MSGAGPLLLVGTGVAMLAWTWRSWPDPLVDFGRELYVPWRLAEGDRLYSGIAWFNGPLSQHWNALLFRVFGPGLTVLVWSNVLVLIATVSMTYALVTRLTGRLAATVAGMVFLLVFAFGQYVGIGNYNWVTPYSHEITHGIALALAAVVALGRWARDGTVRFAALGGLALGLCFLTKVEPFLAGAAACAVLLAPALLGRSPRPVGAFAAAAVVPVLLSASLVGLEETLGAWPFTLQSDVVRLPYYASSMGLDAAALRATEVAAWSSIWLLVLGVFAAAAWLARGTTGRALPFAAAAVTMAALALIGDPFVWREAVRPLSLLALLTTAALALRLGRGPRSHRAIMALALAAFSLTLLLKMILNVRVAHYGFALAGPAAVLAVTILVGWAPAWLARHGARGDVFLACVLAVLGVFALRHVEATGVWLGGKTVWVGEGRDAFRADARGGVVDRAAAYVEASGAAALAVLPEGVMINYLARTPAPTPFVTFMPPEEAMFGDSAWTVAFEDARPDLVLLVPRDASEYGRAPFGFGFGRSLAAWLYARYTPVGEIALEGVPFRLRAFAPAP